ncbi:GntR family transcriptional regulator [Anaerobacillus alkalidiazotrophicus]|uniref:GntR family transcriptional regulator n=1 Tax=Anaerobacillus alkalidiazotrophicus TaxID=472963 RepID=A0A1S2M363_9BACI|nr:GntR family transcriptional regulator [Anaerobacillus alkalidiazotrophicus]OIJ19202.1 GntR family transcriptional regulator [Anaerobacillus alkalidiazotrophicus]
MVVNPNSNKPIYVQIAEWLETEILSGNINSDEKIYSQYQLAEIFTINPATAAKGLNILVDQKILYKKRGLGMFVSENAKEMVLMKRKSETLQQMIEDLVSEAQRLAVSEAELIEMIKSVKKEEEGRL